MPPPPRPAFLDENIATDGVTTCDMCSWAWQEDGGDGSGRYSGRGSGYGGGVGVDGNIHCRITDNYRIFNNAMICFRSSRRVKLGVHACHSVTDIRSDWSNSHDHSLTL